MAVPVAVDVPDSILAELRRICLGLPDAYEEAAWVGVRWCVAKHTFAHVLVIDSRWPPAYPRHNVQLEADIRRIGPKTTASSGVSVAHRTY